LRQVKDQALLVGRQVAEALRSTAIAGFDLDDVQAGELL
jgi:hypothetical protein